MELRSADITIAVTVYDRRDFILDAVRSALDQTVPVKVIVVEDCGPDSGLRDFVLKEFGGRVEYFRNPKNRGLFDNWNACLEYCRTPWLSILHDDDLLHSNFVETMLALAKTAPGRSLYFGQSAILEGKKMVPAPAVPWPRPWRDIDVVDFADECFVLFPGQLLNVARAKAIGGFRKKSYFTGDWDLWFRLAVKFGAAQTGIEVSTVRSHMSAGRGTSRVARMGWKWALDNVQRKRNLALLKVEKGIEIPFDREKLLQQSPVSSRQLRLHARFYSRRILNYNAWMFVRSRAPHARYSMLQQSVKFFGPNLLKVWSKLLS